MLCIPITTSLHHHTPNHKMLRSFRSHKSMRSGHSFGSKVEHARYPSDASSMDSRSSTTSSNGRMAFDPLRCHPPDLTVTHRPSLNISEDGPRRPSRSLPEPHHAQHHYTTTPRVHHHSHQPTTPTTVIYDGFDFGFHHKKSAPTPAPAHGSPGVASPSSPTPSTDSFSSSFSSDSMESNYCVGLTVAPKPRQGPQKEVSAAMARPRGLDAADDFIKRGGWKRRGVIFELEAPMADEEECFDLDMD
ncbi:hypothetical protein B0T13DRAFT_472334 [Neurospora crassa]|nr:hypothetical protein B0T13DRAFT_472334 [Neurospora crassa]